MFKNQCYATDISRTVCYASTSSSGKVCMLWISRAESYDIPQVARKYVCYGFVISRAKGVGMNIVSRAKSDGMIITSRAKSDGMIIISRAKSGGMIIVSGAKSGGMIIISQAKSGGMIIVSGALFQFRP
jgi:hypothetical protein